MDLPITFTEKMNRLLGAQYEDYLQSFQSSGFRGLRVNTSKISVEEFEKISPFPLKKIPWISNGFYIDENAKASRHPFYAAGLYYLQEPSAMTPAAVLPIAPGDKVLDLCAAPGGKATELAAKLNHTGILVANDISNSRAKGLLKNLELFGMPNILVTSETPERLLNFFEGYFDKILIDAPCSGEGMFRKEASMVKSWMEHGPEYYAEIQKSIVEQASKLLAPNGVVLYSTCTFSPEENEAIIAHLMEYDPSFELLTIASYEGFSEGRPDMIQNGSAELKKCVRIYPHKMDGEGHFLALLHKRPIDKISDATIRASKTKADLPEDFMKFLKLLNLDFDDSDIRIFDEKVYLLPGVLGNIKGLRFLRTGLLLGELAKKRFSPSQALAMSLKSGQCSAVIDFDVSDERVIKYLKGETLDVDDMSLGDASGWHLICVCGYPLGWGKLINGTLRNKYYPGWTW